MDNDIFKHPRMKFIPPIMWKFLAIVFVIALVFKLVNILLTKV